MSSGRATSLRLLLALSFLIACSGAARAQPESIPVRVPPGMPSVHPADSASSQYDGRVAEILRLFGLSDLTAGPHTVFTHRDVDKSERLPLCLPVIYYKHRFGWRFSVEAFERQIAAIKTIARQNFSAAAVRASLRHSATLPIEWDFEYPRGMRYVDSLSSGRFRFPRVDSRSFRRHALRQIYRANGPAWIASEVPSHEPSPMRYCVNDGREWCIGEPVPVFRAAYWDYVRFAANTDIAFPILQNGFVQAHVDIRAYAGSLASFSQRDLRLNWPVWPHVTLDQAAQMVERERGERAVRAIYTSALSTTVLVVAVLTERNNLYLVDPLIRKIW